MKYKNTKNKDNKSTQIAYSFWARPTEKLPDSFWKQAERMREIWNMLCDKLYEFEERAKVAKERTFETLSFNERNEFEKWKVEFEIKRQENYKKDCEKKQSEGKRPPKQLKVLSEEVLFSKFLTDPIWQEWRDWYYVFQSNDCNKDLHWASREVVFTKFEAAQKRVIDIRKEGQKASIKKQNGRLQRLTLTHRFSGGGTSVGKLFGTNGKTGFVHLRALTDDYVQGVFQLGDKSTFPFEIVMHREVPASAKVKTVTWSGKRHPVRGWQWKLNLSVEQIADEPSYSLKKECAVNFGWRVIGDYLRIATVATSKGEVFEIRMPFDLSNNRTRRDKLPSSFKDVWVLESQIGNLVEDVKSKLKCSSWRR